jgi:maleate cis-trans isomerase
MEIANERTEYMRDEFILTNTVIACDILHHVEMAPSHTNEMVNMTTNVMKDSADELASACT